MDTDIVAICTVCLIGFDEAMAHHEAYLKAHNLDCAGEVRELTEPVERDKFRRMKDPAKENLRIKAKKREVA